MLAMLAMLAKVMGLRVATRRLALVGLVGCLSLAMGLAGCGGAGGTPGGGTTNAPTATATATPQPTTCAQVQGFGGASSLTLPNMELPTGAVAAAPTTSFGGAGQYTIKTYTVCVPKNTSDLIVSTGKGPEPLTHLLAFYGWATWTWETLSVTGDGHEACADSCFAFNVDNAAKGLFSGAPRFLSLDQVTPLANGLVTFTLKLAQAADPACSSMFNTSDMAMYGHAPEYTLYYDFGGPGASIQMEWPPMTRLVGDSAPDVVGQDLCSAGTAASVKAFMDSQFAAHGFTSVACTMNGNDCWKNGATTVTMNITSASDWTLSTPRTLP
jgi:hypothetical protein